jgi:hypothetical protein
LDLWRKANMTLLPPARSTSENYLYCLPALLANRVRLVDNATLRNQLSALERRVCSSNKETVDHPQHATAHDDLAAAVCGAIAAALAAVMQQVPLVAPYVVNKYGDVLADPAMIARPQPPSPAPTAAKAPSASPSKVDTVVNSLPPNNKVPASYRAEPPAHYLKGGTGSEPWRQFVEGDGLHWASVGRWGHVGTKPWRE